MLKNYLDPAQFSSAEIREPLTDNWRARRKVSAATTRLIENLVTCTADTDVLEQVAQVLEQQAERLNTEKRIYGRTSFEAAGGYGTFPQVDYEFNPLDGKSNPVAPPLVTWIDGDRAHGKVTMGWQYEGPPGAVHGGMVAALFDQFLGIGQIVCDRPGFTGTLTIKYLKPTPIDTELRLEGWVDREEGRKNFLVAEIWAGDVRTAVCEGVFISVSPDVFQTMRDAIKE